jgi:hypothetical protein
MRPARRRLTHLPRMPANPNQVASQAVFLGPSMFPYCFPNGLPAQR